MGIKKYFQKKQGISPVIATVLLIAMVVVVGLIVFMWFRGMAEETITKFGGTNIELVCGDVRFVASYSSSGIFSLANTGNVPIFGMKAKISEQGSYQTLDFKDFSVDWPENGLLQGGAFSADMYSWFGDADEVVIIPVLMGNSDKGRKLFVCDEQYNQKVI